ncbi:phage/plasmid primase, P4 family [Bacillus subtilis]|uniref:DNA primase family protein n=1 Tax=Bacillus subtilis TaxID=1423 RepID=UPI001D0829A1|nr:phage/plasmid primase, P4 family [Bacillus subtilis]MCB7162451.1 phage/plasmid primase, P4 family [Bacillus subtilis]MCB7461332.1 phage/plasmid primase, P4 family [Bacillus subtilis]
MEKSTEKSKAERLRERGTDKLLEEFNSIQKKEQCFSYTDLGNAERLMYEHGGNFRYHIERKKWFYWNGKYWEVDNKNHLKRKAIEVVKGLQNEIEHIQNADERELFLKHIVRSQSASRIQAMLTLADSVSSDITINESMLDYNEYLLNVANGTINLKMLEMYGVTDALLSAHNPEDLITQYVDIPFNPDAKCPTWLRFLNDIFMGNQEIISYVQRAVGYSLTGSNKKECLFMLYGPKGRNGKSTLEKAIHKLMGDYAGHTDPSTFMKKGNTARHTLAEFSGVRFLSTSEVERGEELAVQLIKQITGRDPIEAERKYEQPFTYIPKFKIWMLTNNKPSIYERRKAIWERIHLIEFNRYFEEHERDKNLDKKLESEMEGILVWALEGCLEWQRQGLNRPAEVQDAVKRYEEEQDIIGQFISENYDVDTANEDYWEVPDRMYQNYKSWCSESGFGCLNKNNFGIEMKERFAFKSKRVEFNGKIQPKKVYVGIRSK